MKTDEKSERSTLRIYRRILRIDRLLSDGTYPTLEDLTKDHFIEGSRATVYRTLEFMRNELNAPIEKDPTSKGFYYSDRTFRLPIMWTSEQQMFAVTTLKNMLSYLDGTPLCESARQVLEVIEKSTVKNPSGSFEFQDGKSLDLADSAWIANRYVFLDGHHSGVEKIVWDKIAKAMRQNKVIEFDYLREYDGKSERRKVKPYQVLKSRDDWTLWAGDLRRSDYRLFTLSRISGIRITETIFSLPKDFEYEKHSQAKDSVWYNAAEHSFKIWLSDAATEKTTNYVWGKKQRTAKSKQGGYVVSFSASNKEWVMEKILSLAEHARPLSPKTFCAEYAEHIRKMGAGLGE